MPRMSGNPARDECNEVDKPRTSILGEVMSDIKERIAYAKGVAKRKFKEIGYDIMNSDNEIFCFSASIAGIHERKVRVVVDRIAKEDIILIKKFHILSNQTKEVWCKSFKSRDWEILRFNHLNEPCDPCQ